MSSERENDFFGLNEEMKSSDEDLGEMTGDVQTGEDIDEADESEESIEESIIDRLKEKYFEISAVVRNKAYEICMEPDEKTLVGPERSKLIVITATVLAVLIGLGSILFCGLYPWRNTGVKVKDFIRCFNSIVVDEKIETVFEDYQDMTIPEKAKLGGKNEIAIYDGHVVISADVSPLGYIRSMETRIVDLPGFDEEKNAFSTENNEDFYYYYVAVGKIILALHQAYSDTLPDGGLPEETTASSADVSASDAGDGLYTVYDAATAGYQTISYAQLYNSYGYAPDYTMDFGNMRVAYNDPLVKLSVSSIETTLAKLPEGLQKLFEKKEESPYSEAEVSSADTVSSADAVSAADAA